jgi:hypothetical protein
VVVVMVIVMVVFMMTFFVVVAVVVMGRSVMLALPALDAAVDPPLRRDAPSAGARGGRRSQAEDLLVLDDLV